MSLFDWLFRRTKSTTTLEVWESQRPAQLPLTEQRTYLDDAPYLLPKDALEDQRLNFQHHMLYRTISNHYLAPITTTTTTILDVGTGTGIWPIEMAALFPQAHILGVDVALSSLPHPLPTNCLFSQANILQGLPLLKTVYTRAGIELTGPQEGCKLADISSRDYPQETASDQEPDSE